MNSIFGLGVGWWNNLCSRYQFGKQFVRIKDSRSILERDNDFAVEMVHVVDFHHDRMNQLGVLCPSHALPGFILWIQSGRSARCVAACLDFRHPLRTPALPSSSCPRQRVQPAWQRPLRGQLGESGLSFLDQLQGLPAAPLGSCEHPFRVRSLSGFKVENGSHVDGVCSISTFPQSSWGRSIY